MPGLSSRTISALFSSSGDSLIAPEATNPLVYFDRLKSSCTDKPEMRLALAVLAVVLDDYQKALTKENTSNQSENSRKNATKIVLRCERWIMDKRYDWLYSFQSICDLFGINSDSLRGGIAKFKKTIRTNNRTKIKHSSNPFRNRHNGGIAHYVIGTKSKL